MTTDIDHSKLAGSPLLYRLVLLTIVGAIIAAVLLRGNSGERTAPAPEASEALTSAELVERILNRFRYPPQGAGILHEVVEFDGPVLRSLRRHLEPEPMTLERWYDYGPPARLRLELRQGDRLVYAVATNGSGQVQIDASRRGVPGTGIRSKGSLRVTATLSPDDEELLLPILRQPYANGGLFGAFPTLPPPVMELLYAADANPAYADGTFLAAFFSLPPPLLEALQAARTRPADVQPLGNTVALGRPAWLLGVEGRDRSYLLTVDQQTYTILDVQELQRGGQHDVLHRWRTTLLEVLETVPDERFQLGPSSWGYQHSGPLPPPWYWFDQPTAALPPPTDETPPFALMLPDPAILSDSLRTIVWSAPPRVSIDWFAVTTLWSEHGLAIITQLPRRGGLTPQRWIDEEGGQRFVLLPSPDRRADSPALYAMVDAGTLPTGEPLTRLYIGVFLPLASPEEREETIRQIIGSLKPATAEDMQAYWLFKHTP